MARAFPATVPRIYEEGHTIGTHSEDHPTRFGQLPVEKMRHRDRLGHFGRQRGTGRSQISRAVLSYPRSGAIRSGLKRTRGAWADSIFLRHRRRRLASPHQWPTDHCFGDTATGSARQRHSASSRHPSGDRRRAARAPPGARGQRFPYRAGRPGRVPRDRDGEQAQSPKSDLNAGSGRR